MCARSDQFEQLYVSEHKRLQRQIRKRIGCAATACDLVQDVFLRFWESATERAENPAAFLSRSTRNAVIDHVRAEGRRSAFFDGLRPEQMTQAEPMPLDIVAARQKLRAIENALAALPARTRHIFLLNRIHGRTFVEIADVMGISERAVAKHMQRAMEACDVP